MKRRLYYLNLIGLVLISLIYIINNFANTNWIFDLLINFQFQYWILTIVALVFLLFAKEQKTVFIFLPLFFYLSIEIGNLYLGKKRNLNTNSVKITSINVLSTNMNYQKVINFINNENPEIVIIQEITPTWENALKAGLIEYKEQLIVSRKDNFGIALYSKISLNELQIVRLDEISSPSIQADFEIENKKITLLATHPVPPINQNYFNKRNHQLSEIARFTKNESNEVIVVGDLNITSFSSFFKKLQKESDLIDSRKGFGIQSTWTAFGLFNITLDHCLISKGLRIKNREVGEAVGSDHLPILIEIGVK